jgi:hypothetical protein
MSQESATAYSDSDLGQQELGYMKTWHAQTWNGDQTYPYRNPAAFQTRLARITKEQIEKLRVSPVQGWFAFSTCTWYNITCNDPNPAGTIQPYPVHDAVGKALAPVLVMLDSSARNYFAGAKISAVVKAVDDRQSPPSPLTGLRLKTTLTAKNGSVLFDNTVPFPDMPQTQKPVDQSVELAIPDTLPDERTEAALHLSLLDGNGATVAQNDYDFTLCMPSYAKSSDSSSKNSPTTSASESASGTVLAQKPDDSQWPSLLRQAQDGATVIALDPVSLPEPLVSRGAKLVETDFNGECAHVTSPKGSPLLEGMEENDLAWWPASDGSFLAYKKAITFDHPLPDDIRPLVYHVPPHGYDGKWRMHFPVIRLQVGKGAVIISTLNFEGTSRDPLAARFYNNLIAHGK